MVDDIPLIYRARTRLSKLGDPQQVLGFKTFDIDPADFESEEYREVFMEVHNYFSRYLNIAGAADAADLGLKRYAPSLANTFLDYSLFWGFEIADWAYCRNNPYNHFDTSAMLRRYAQAQMGATMKNPDTGLDGLKDLEPLFDRVFSKYIPVKTAMMMLIVVERADERYFNGPKKARPRNGRGPGLRPRIDEEKVKTTVNQESVDYKIRANERLRRPAGWRERRRRNRNYQRAYGMTQEEFIENYHAFLEQNRGMSVEDVLRAARN